MQNELVKLARPELVAMKAYSSARSEASGGRVFLDANENPWNESVYNRYPEPQPEVLVSKLSALYGVRAEQLLLTRGSDEGIDLLIRLFCRAGVDKILVCPPTYGLYQVAARIQGAGVVEVPLVKKRDFALDTSGVLASFQPSVKLLFLCSPNNPTGNLLVESEILALCSVLTGKAIVIVDEAYIEFSLRESLTRRLGDYSNLVILRTLSKAYGLAGIRCGVTLAHPEVIQLLKKLIAPYPIPQPISSLVLQNLNCEGVKKQVAVLREEREKLARFLENLAFVKKVWKSDANFLLFEAKAAKLILDLCLQNGLVLRDRGRESQLANCIRATIGSPSENQFLMEVLSRA